jgi:hypothetical protein
MINDQESIAEDKPLKVEQPLITFQKSGDNPSPAR